MKEHNTITNKWPGIGQSSVCQLISSSLGVGDQELGKVDKTIMSRETIVISTQEHIQSQAWRNVKMSNRSWTI